MVQKITFYKLKPTDASPLNKENVRTNINWVYSGSFFFFAIHCLVLTISYQQL